ncbi:glycosyltransferase [Hydrogenophaga sp.]|uniref:MraY family glycosyltransferase n=1 Tax=Hydrogenophaga sp. TaxID=1904254 RepID=UPI0019BFA9E0|nr:glycosyltransferase [Hydrogenophaga sp.]MBD3894141.1 glycosyl transferase [Hydrogenophaga sp.]
MPNFVLAALLVSLGVSLLLVFTKHWHGHFSMDHTAGVQKFHTKPTPRIGGVGVAAGLVAAWALASADVQTLLQPLLLASVPAFAAGLLEDITKKVGVSARLLATMVSGALACWLTGVALNRVDVPLLDDLLAWGPAAVLFTAFAVAGVANAVNIIDGFNGLSSGTVLVILAALGSLAGLQGDTPLALVCAVLGAAVLGFWLVNFPLGKIFLGDGGAYLVGFALAWLAVLLVMRHPGVSPWLVLLACAYPVTEVLYSVWRRLRQRLPTGAPDNLHLHSLIKTQVIMRWLAHWNPRLRNAAVSPLLWLYAALPAGLAVALEGAPVWAAIAALLVCVHWYHLIYQLLARRAQLHPLPDGAPSPPQARPRPQPKPRPRRPR